MKLIDLKNALDKLTEEQLEGELIVKGLYWDGVASGVELSKENYYWDGEDDPSELITEAEMKTRVEDGEFDEMPEAYIEKGSVILHC